MYGLQAPLCVEDQHLVHQVLYTILQCSQWCWGSCHEPHFADEEIKCLHQVICKPRSHPAHPKAKAQSLKAESRVFSATLQIESSAKGHRSLKQLITFLVLPFTLSKMGRIISSMSWVPEHHISCYKWTAWTRVWHIGSVIVKRFLSKNINW